MAYIQPEVIAEARKVDLLSYLQATDPHELVKCDGNEYCLAHTTHSRSQTASGFGGQEVSEVLLHLIIL